MKSMRGLFLGRNRLIYDDVSELFHALKTPENFRGGLLLAITNRDGVGFTSNVINDVVMMINKNASSTR